MPPAATTGIVGAMGLGIDEHAQRIWVRSNTAGVWIRDVDVPPELVEAARAGELVIFVGAGASRDQPAGLPDFRSLVEDIGAQVGNPPTQDDQRRPDVYLGRLADDHGIDVHRLVANLLNQPGSKPNALHKAIVRLAAVHQSPRIVTTNYDVHLTTAAVEEGLVLPVYQAPALPVGDDFRGIVHLHGALTQEPRRLVVTDKDFGRAYLLEAWAARFLERMFSAFTVLFIGYSHGDVVMQYLARSLAPSGRRFVCTNDGNDPAWRQYGLTAVSYVLTDGDHVALPRFVARWADLSAMGHTQHRAQIATLVAAGPPTIPEDVSYLDEVLAHPERIRYFVDKARGTNWFAWVAERPAFQTLFDRDGATAPQAATLMSWVADNYILDESDSPLALRAMRDKPWPTETWGTVVHRLFAHEGEMKTWLSPWLLIAMQRAPGSRDELLDMLLADNRWGDNVGLALALLEDRTRPVLTSAMSFGSDAARFEVDLPGDEHWLSEAWSTTFVPMLGEHLGIIMRSIDEQLARVYRTLDSLGSDFDPISFGRSAIEPHEQDSFRESMDVLIDAARDCIERALASDIGLADRCISDWAGRSDAIFRRLAIHALRVRVDQSADEKLRRLRTCDWVWEVPLQHEVYLLLKDALPAASDETVREFVDVAKAGPAARGDEEVSPYRSYNLLAWIAQSTPGHQAASTAFAEYQKTHPEFAPREHPDLNRYMSSGVVEDAPPFSVEELHARIAKDPTSAVADLREFRTSERVISGPTWTGALRSLQACVSAFPSDGLTVADVLEPSDGDLVNAVIEGWSTTKLAESSVVAVLRVVDNWPLDEVRRVAAGMLSNGGSQTNPTPWHRYAPARETARRLWPAQEVDSAVTTDDDLVMEAINHPAGDLAEFWTKAVQWDWTVAGDAWNGLTDELKAELARMTSSDGRSSLLASTFLASQLHFYFAADAEWATSHLLPLFDWSREKEQAPGAWQGFLTWGRPNDGLLSAGLLDGYVETCRHQDLLGPRLPRELSVHLAMIALQSGLDPLQWLPRFVLAAPEGARVSWVHQVDRFLEELDPSEAGDQWERWLRDYWLSRLASTPLPLTSDETGAMAGWLVGLPTVRAEAVALLIQTPGGLSQHDQLLYRLKDIDLSADAGSWASAITHLLRGTTGPQYVLRHYLEGIIQKLRAGVPGPDLSELVEEALRLGVTEAADW